MILLIITSSILLGYYLWCVNAFVEREFDTKRDLLLALIPLFTWIVAIIPIIKDHLYYIKTLPKE
jgi:hypothetical protein